MPIERGPLPLQRHPRQGQAQVTLKLVRHSVRVLQELNRQRQKGQFCDATLAVGSLVFKAHWSVLACCSSFFQTMYGDGGASRKVILPETFVEVFTLLLDFFYTGHLAVTPDNRERLLEMAKKLCVPEAIQLCQEFPSGPSQSSQVPIDRDPGATLPAEEPTGEAEPPGPPDTESPRIRGAKGAQGPQDGPGLPRGKLKRLPKTNVVSRPGDVKDTPECKELKRPLKNEAAEDAGASHEVACGVTETPEVLASSDLPSEDPNGGREKDDTDEDYVPGQESVRVRKRPSLTRASRSSSKTPGNGHNHKAAALRPRRGTAEPVECPTCHKSFLSKYYLKVHNRKHTGEKPFECSKCGKCYFRKENLLDHEARNCVNRSEQVHTCSVCQEVFKKRVELRLHMVTHTGEMPYKCCSCIQQFMQKKELQSHLIKLHGAPKPHACSSCSKCFLSRTELSLHEAFKHRGEKLFVCEECGHRASSRNGLQMHVKAKHRQVPAGKAPGRSDTTPRRKACCSLSDGALPLPARNERPHAHLRRHMEIHDRVKNYNPRQRKLRNLVIEDEKVVVVALQAPNVLEVGSAEVIVEALAQSAPSMGLPAGQRLCSDENLGPAEVTEQTFLITIPNSFFQRKALPKPRILFASKEKENPTVR
ncbi:Zinc finger and BTB domain-containing protein 48, partial [Ophiophagus hannah]